MHWVTVYTGKPMEIEFARTVLEEAGIPTGLPDPQERHFTPYVTGEVWQSRLQVPEPYAERARNLLAGTIDVPTPTDEDKGEDE